MEEEKVEPVEGLQKRGVEDEEEDGTPNAAAAAGGVANLEEHNMPTKDVVLGVNVCTLPLVISNFVVF